MNYTFENINNDTIKLYLTKNGWTISTLENGGFISISPSNILDGQLEIYFPSKKSHYKWYDLTHTNIHTLSKIYTKSFEEIIKEISEVYRTVFKALINKKRKMDSLPLNFARITINSLYNFLLYAYSYEFQPVAYFIEAPPKALKEVSKIQFPHTFDGSFGLSFQMGTEDDVLFDLSTDISLKEKVIDRIFSGFDFLKLSIEEQNENYLVENYDIGFNANMCDALSKIAKNLSSNTVTFDFSYPYKKNKNTKLSPYTLKENSYEILTQASRTLKIRNPILNTKIEGYIIATQDKSRDLLIPPVKNPKRTIIVSARIIFDLNLTDKLDEKNKRKKEIIVYLDNETYTKAVEAHKNSAKISITGDLYKKNNNELELLNAKDFKVNLN